MLKFETTALGFRNMTEDGELWARQEDQPDHKQCGFLQLTMFACRHGT